MTQLKEETDIFVARYTSLEESTPASSRSWLDEIRAGGIRRFQSLGYPGPRAEEWKYTSVAPLKKVPFSREARSPAFRSSLEEIRDAVLDLGLGPRLVFVDGRICPELSLRDELPPAARLLTLLECLEIADPLLRERLGHELSVYASHPFVALNTAFLDAGAILHVPRGTACDQPVHLVFISTAGAEPTAIHPRILVLAEESAQVALVEDYASLGAGVHFTNPVTEISVGENAVVEHHRVVRENQAAIHISATAVRQRSSSVFTSHSLNLGGSLVRNDVHCILDGEGAECTLNGLLVGTGARHVDNHTRIVHASPHCRSWEVYKGVLGDRATGVFNGKIFVCEGAQKTDSKQSSQTLLLSEGAEMNAKPELEIYADDVRCTHGATVGQLDESAVFYLRSRGIDAAAARNILTYAFGGEVIDQIKIDALRRGVEELMYSQLPGADLLASSR